MTQVSILVAVSTGQLAPAELTPAQRAHLPPPDRPVRRAEWLRARRALRVLTTLTGRADLPTSLAHSATTGVAATTVGPAAVAGIGVDIEEPRPVRPQTARFFLHGDERACVTDPAAHLRLWTIKEALLKADPDSADAMLHDYTLAEAASTRGRATSARNAHLRLRYASGMLGPARISVAATTEPRTRKNWRTMPDVTFDIVAERVHALLNLGETELTPDTELRKLAADSFQLVEVVIDLQEELDTIVTQDQLREVRTLGELTAVLQSAQGGPYASAS